VTSAYPRVKSEAGKTGRSTSKGLSTEQAGFDAIFLEHWNSIYTFLFHLVGEREEAQDLALEVFYRLYRHPPASTGSLAGWLYRVAANLGYNALRSQQRRLEYERRSMEWYPEAANQDPQHIFEQAEERRQVRRILARMKPRSAKILVLRHSGLSYAEIADAVGVSPGSVGTLLARAEREFEKYHQG
jgi:RNA polymerase sigma-70 factor, ECF subfamily